MAENEPLRIWFLNVGHGDCIFIALPNQARMMIDCGSSEHWPSKMLKHYRITKKESPNKWGYGLDKLVISHPHGDHIADIAAIHDEIGFKWLRGGYSNFIDDIDDKNIDFRKRNQDAIKKFKEIVKNYTGDYIKDEDGVAAANPPCVVKYDRFLSFSKGMDLNELSWFVSFEIGGHKILFPGDMTAAGVNKILASPRANDFKNFVKGTTILKVPHHGRENGCSEEMFKAFGTKPLLCVASDKILDGDNEGTSNIDWYKTKTSDKAVRINGESQKRWVLTTRKDGDICIFVSDKGDVEVMTHCFAKVREEIL